MIARFSDRFQTWKVSQAACAEGGPPKETIKRVGIAFPFVAFSTFVGFAFLVSRDVMMRAGGEVRMSTYVVRDSEGLEVRWDAWLAFAAVSG